MKFLTWLVGDLRDALGWLYLVQLVTLFAFMGFGAETEWLIAFVLMVGTIVVRRTCPYRPPAGSKRT